MNQVLENEEVLEEFFDNPPMKRGWLLSPLESRLACHCFISRHDHRSDPWGLVPRGHTALPSSLEAPSVEPLAATSAAQLPWDLHTAQFDGQSQESPALLKLLEPGYFVLQQWGYQLPALQNTRQRARLPCENIISGLFVLTEFGFGETEEIEVLELIIVT